MKVLDAMFKKVGGVGEKVEHANEREMGIVKSVVNQKGLGTRQRRKSGGESAARVLLQHGQDVVGERHGGGRGAVTSFGAADVCDGGGGEGGGGEGGGGDACGGDLSNCCRWHGGGATGAKQSI